MKGRYRHAMERQRDETKEEYRLGMWSSLTFAEMNTFHLPGRTIPVLSATCLLSNENNKTCQKVQTLVFRKLRDSMPSFREKTVWDIFYDDVQNLKNRSVANFDSFIIDF